jgi:hypothetical protein
MNENSTKRSFAAIEADRMCGLLDDIADTERAINALQAAQVQQVAAFVQARQDFEMGSYGSWSDAAERIAAAELADARRVGVWTSQSYLADCQRLVGDLPRVFAKLTGGVIGLAAARSAAQETFPLHPATLPLADEVIADEIDTVLPGQVRAMVRARVIEIDPDAAMATATQARHDRWVGAGIDPTTSMGNLNAHLPAEQVAACWTALDDHARGRYADGDSRSVSQIMADTLVERITGQSDAADVAVTINVVMNTTTLFGLDDSPAMLDNLGPIPAAIARQLAANDKAWLRRWFTDPADATVTTIDTKQRRFTGGLRWFVTARDRRCRGICCDASIRDGNHLRDHAAGGQTSAGNAAGQCQRCHHLEDHPDMCVEAVGGHDLWGRRTHQAETGAAAALLRWTTPIGRQIITHARPALGYGTATKAQLQHRRRLRNQAASPHSPPGFDLHPSSALELQLAHHLHHAA